MLYYYAVEDFNPGGCEFQVTGLEFSDNQLIAVWHLDAKGVLKTPKPDEVDSDGPLWSIYANQTLEGVAADPKFTTDRAEALAALVVLLGKAIEVVPEIQDNQDLDPEGELLTTWWKLQEHFVAHPHPLITPLFTE